jgi:alkyl hydroperoxide reductase subunit AhpF
MSTCLLDRAGKIINPSMNDDQTPSQRSTVFDAETWEHLHDAFDKMPNAVQINLWGDPQMSLGEAEATRLCRTLADAFEQISFRPLPRRINYDYYPVLGIMGLEDGEEQDFGLRIIGLPAGYQLTSLIAAVQAASFRGVTLEPKTRLLMRGLSTAVTLEILSAAEDETGALVAKHGFGLAVASPDIRTYLIMGDVFEEALIKYSVSDLPHTVINGHYHVNGMIEEEETLLRHIASAVKKSE